MARMLFGLCLLQGVAAAATAKEREEEALATLLASDSECHGEDATCALNALQVKRQALEAQEASADDALEQEDDSIGAKEKGEKVGADSVDRGEEEFGISLASSCSGSTSTSGLVRCADDTVSTYASQISSNLRRHGISKLDLAWPGTGFNQAAFAGQWQALMAVEKSGGLQVENVVGSSGGASSAILALADRSRSARTLMDTLLSSSWGSVQTSGEYKKYKSVLSSGNWRAVQKHGYASVSCDSNSSVSYIVHNFKSQDQAAKAFAASGDIPSILFGNGYSLGGHLKFCHDNGEIMGPGTNPLLYYNNNYGCGLSCTKSKSIDLFKKGVKATVAALLSSNLRIGSGGGGSVAIQKPHGNKKWTLSQYRNWLGSGGFYEILFTGSAAPRVFVDGASLSGGSPFWR